MPRRTDGEKIDELEKLVAQILEKLKAVDRSIEGLSTFDKEILQRMHDLQRAHETAIAVLQEKASKLEAALEKAGNRAWSVVPNIVGAVVSGLIAALVAYFVARR
jgi:hypothetical protein